MLAGCCALASRRGGPACGLSRAFHRAAVTWRYIRGPGCWLPSLDRLPLPACVPGFHPHWWPDMSAASLALCKRLLLPQRDALPPPAMADAGPGLPAAGVRETDVQVGAAPAAGGAGRQRARQRAALLHTQQLHRERREDERTKPGVRVCTRLCPQPLCVPAALTPCHPARCATIRLTRRRCTPAWVATELRRWRSCGGRRVAWRRPCRTRCRCAGGGTTPHRKRAALPGTLVCLHSRRLLRTPAHLHATAVGCLPPSSLPCGRSGCCQA